MYAKKQNDTLPKQTYCPLQRCPYTPLVAEGFRTNQFAANITCPSPAREKETCAVFAPSHTLDLSIPSLPSSGVSTIPIANISRCIRLEEPGVLGFLPLENSVLYNHDLMRKD